MTPTDLVAQTVQQLAPALPALIFVGTEAAKEIVKKTTAAALDAAGKIWAWLRPKAEAHPALAEAVEKLALDPANADRQDTLRTRLLDLLDAHPQLLPELGGLIQQIAVQHIHQELQGRGNIQAGGSITARDIQIKAG